MKPRWKIIVELLFGIFWFVSLPLVLWDRHEHDEVPFNVIWLLIAVINVWAAWEVISSRWREL